MKRRDWRTKKLKKNISGKFFKRRRLFFLRKLFLRKNNVFFKKNLIPNFYFYKRILNTILINKLKNFKKFTLNNIYNKCFYNKFLPVFFYKKKVFNYENSFKKLMHTKNLKYFFIGNQKNNIGNNIILFDKNQGKIDSKEICNDDNKHLILYKSQELSELNLNLKKNINFFFNFNFFFLNSLEIYKIMIILYINKLK